MGGEFIGDNKINPMHIERPCGYVSAFAAHGDPAYSVPPPSVIQRKEEETLIGHCLKQLIKERMYGNLITYDRKRSAKRYNFNPQISSLDLEKTEEDQTDLPTMKTAKHRLSDVTANLERKTQRLLPNVRTSVQVNPESAKKTRYSLRGSL